MTIYGHLVLNTDQHKYPNISYNAYTCCTKLVYVFGGVWGPMGCYGGNINTNTWMGRHVYARSRPTTNRGILVFVAPYSSP